MRGDEGSLVLQTMPSITSSECNPVSLPRLPPPARALVPGHAAWPLSFAWQKEKIPSVRPPKEATFEAVLQSRHKLNLAPTALSVQGDMERVKINSVPS